MDEVAKKATLRLLTYGLYALTAREGDDASAMTVNWVTQVSFAPPLVAVSIEQGSYTGALALRTGQFVLCVYADEQRALAGQLGRHRARTPDKFAGVIWEPGAATGCPILAGALGALECRVVGTLPAGDSTLVTAEVVAAHHFRDGEPLTMRVAGWKHAG